MLPFGTAALETECEDDWAPARRADGLTTVLAVLLGPPGSSAAVERARGRDAFGEHSATPLFTVLHPGGTLLPATLVVLTADRGGVEICSPDGTGSLLAPLP